jgi:hypothetical protein
MHSRIDQKPRRVPRVTWLALGCLLFFVTGVTGCATGSKADGQTATAMTKQAKPGAQGWSEHALLLPKESPIVVMAQLDQLLIALDDTWDWVVAEPAMLGDNGEQIVAFLKGERRKLTGAEGLDPLSPEAWIDLGIDVSRKIYVGSYPVTDEDSVAVIEAVQEVIREAMGLDEDGDVESALTAASVLSGDEPLRIYSDVDQALGELDPLAGFRVVVPLADRDAFLSSLDSFLADLELSRVEATETIRGQADAVELFVAPDLDFQVIMVRVRGDTATVDFLQEPMGARGPSISTDRVEKRAVERAERLVEQFPYGRPSAPLPANEPVAGVAVDQKGAAQFAQIRGIRKALREARGAGLKERDARFTYNLFRAFESAKNWTVASNRLTGLSYGLFVGESDRLLRLGIDLYGEGLDEPLRSSNSNADIDLSERSIAASVDLEPMVDEEWQEWIGVKNPLSVLEGFDAIDFDATLFALSFPRSLAILFTNAEKVFENRLPAWADPLYEQRDLLSRLDVASAGMNIRGMRLTPKVVGVLTLESGLDAEQVDALGESMATALANLSTRAMDLQSRTEADGGEGEADSEAEADDGGLPELAQPTPRAEQSEPEPERLQPAPLQRGTLAALEVDGKTPGDVRYFWRHDGDHPYLFFSYGLSAKEAGSEHEQVTASDSVSREGIMLFRSEPVAIFSLMTFYQPDLFDPVDVGILAQRIGPLSFEVTPEVSDGVQRIRYDFVVGEPPTLGSGAEGTQ